MGSEMGEKIREKRFFPVSVIFRTGQSGQVPILCATRASNWIQNKRDEGISRIYFFAASGSSAQNNPLAGETTAMLALGWRYVD
jgi:hypothetical protein